MVSLVRAINKVVGLPGKVERSAERESPHTHTHTHSLTHTLTTAAGEHLRSYSP